MDELHKLGLLYLQNGNWNGKQLVPENWVKEANRWKTTKTASAMAICSGAAGKTLSEPTENIASGPSSVGRKTRLSLLSQNAAETRN